MSLWACLRARHPLRSACAAAPQWSGGTGRSSARDAGSRSAAAKARRETAGPRSSQDPAGPRSADRTFPLGDDFCGLTTRSSGAFGARSTRASFGSGFTRSCRLACELPRLAGAFARTPCPRVGLWLWCSSTTSGTRGSSASASASASRAPPESRHPSPDRARSPCRGQRRYPARGHPAARSARAANRVSGRGREASSWLSARPRRHRPYPPHPLRLPQ